MIYENINGSYKKINGIYRNVGGIDKEINKRYELVNGITNITFENKKIIYLIKDGVWKVPITKKYGWQNLYSGGSAESHQDAATSISKSNYSYSKNDTVSNYFNFIYSAYFMGVSAWYGYGIKAYYVLTNPIVVKKGILYSEYEQSIPISHTNGTYNGFSTGSSGLGFNAPNSNSYGDASSIAGIVLTATSKGENVLPIGLPANIGRAIRETKISNVTISNISIIYWLYGRYQSTTRITNGNCKIYNLWIEM